MELPKHYADVMVRHALEEDPNECCGILAGRDGQVAHHYRITNSEHSPYRYSMDSRELFNAYREIEDRGWEMQVIYHSHTHSPAYPSNTDVRLATWPEASYLLISLMDKAKPDLRVFHIVDGQITEEPLIIS